MSRQDEMPAVHAAIIRALDEANVRNVVLRGMCVQVGLETFMDDEPPQDRFVLTQEQLRRLIMQAYGARFETPYPGAEKVIEDFLRDEGLMV